MIESEKKLERRLKKEVEARGGMCIKLEANFIAGLPDRMCLLPGGQVFFVEVKTTGKQPSPVQYAVHRMLIKLGFRVYVPDTTEKIKNIIDVERG